MWKTKEAKPEPDSALSFLAAFLGGSARVPCSDPSFPCSLDPNILSALYGESNARQMDILLGGGIIYLLSFPKERKKKKKKITLWLVLEGKVFPRSSSAANAPVHGLSH